MKMKDGRPYPPEPCPGLCSQSNTPHTHEPETTSATTKEERGIMILTNKTISAIIAALPPFKVLEDDPDGASTVNLSYHAAAELWTALNKSQER